MSGRPREFDRDEALDKAVDLFWAQGYERTGVAELCEHLGVGRQSLYNAFGDKKSLFSEALARYQERRLQPVIDLLRGPGSGLANVRRVLEMWEQPTEDGQAPGCLLANSIAEFGIRAPALSPTLGRMLGGVEAAFLVAFQRARDQGELPEGRDPRTLARLMTALGQGVATVAKLDPTGTFTHDALASARALLE